MRYAELREDSRDVVKAAQALAQRYGVKVELSADAPDKLQVVWFERTYGAKGSGGQFLADLIRLCDQHGVTLDLAVWEGHPKLIALYQRFGFEVVDPGGDGEDPIMERQPRVHA